MYYLVQISVVIVETVSSSYGRERGKPLKTFLKEERPSWDTGCFNIDDRDSNPKYIVFIELTLSISGEYRL